MQILGTIEYVFAIVTLLGGVIAVHEFGHFIMAKWCGTRVDIFSIGFGPRLFTKKWGETEYCLSLIPLGGYVKIHGQDIEEFEKEERKEPDRALFNKKLHERIGVFVGGPFFNYILAILIFAFMAMMGVQKLPPQATRVIAHTPAHEAGLRSGDTIVSIDGVPMKNFEEVFEIIAENPGKNLPFTVTRNGKEHQLSVPIHREEAQSPYGESIVTGLLDGLEPLGREAVIATTTGQTAWGLLHGDRILQVNGEKVSSWEDLERYLEARTSDFPKAMNFVVTRDGKETSVTSPDLSALAKRINKSWDALRVMDESGIRNPELFVARTMPGSPAEKAGLQEKDRIVTINGKRVYSFEHLRSVVQQTGDRLARESKPFDGAIKLEVERNGKMIELTSSVLSNKGKDPVGNVIFTYTIGIQSMGVAKLPSNQVLERTLNPFSALAIGAKETWSATAMTVIGIKKLAFGEVSLKAVSGPIMIGKIAGDTLQSRGWRDFLRIMAIISISLGVFNLLPIPILDGGHVVFALIEAARGKPLSATTMQVSLKVGLSLLLLLMVFAVYNDIMKVLH